MLEKTPERRYIDPLHLRRTATLALGVVIGNAARYRLTKVYDLRWQAVISFAVISS